jgi:hypothetical protein
MSLFLRTSYALVFALLVRCTPKNSQGEEAIKLTKTYDLDAISIQLPEAWKPNDYISSGSKPMRKRYLFLNTASQATLRETLIIVIDKHKSTYFEKAVKEMARSFIVPNQMQLLTSRDTMLLNGDLAITEATYRNLQLNLDLAVTCALYRRDSKLIVLTGTALSHSNSIDQANRALFRRMINSIKWK